MNICKILEKIFFIRNKIGFILIMNQTDIAKSLFFMSFVKFGCSVRG